MNFFRAIAILAILLASVITGGAKTGALIEICAAGEAKFVVVPAGDAPISPNHVNCENCCIADSALPLPDIGLSDRLNSIDPAPVLMSEHLQPQMLIMRATARAPPVV